MNRLALWRGGLRMIASRAMERLGLRRIWAAYMNWFQDLDRTESYATMVNRYLHGAVE